MKRPPEALRELLKDAQFARRMGWGTDIPSIRIVTRAILARLREAREEEKALVERGGVK